MSARFGRLALGLSVVLLLAACAAAPRALPGTFVVAVPARAGGRLTLDFAPAAARALTALARPWRPDDIVQLDIAVALFDPQADAFVAPPLPFDVSLPQKPTPTTRATFDGLDLAGRYRFTVTARGNLGGSAPEQVLNATRPAVLEVDFADPDLLATRSLAVPLDPVPFAAELRLPGPATRATPFPTWLTGFAARLLDPGRGPTPVASASWAPAQDRSFVNVRGDLPYRVELDVKSAAGTRTQALSAYTVVRSDGAEQVVTPDFGELVAPTGTLLASYTMSGGAFAVAVDSGDRVWTTNQTGNTVTIKNFDGSNAVAPIAINGQPRAMAIDPLDGTAWIASFTGSAVTKLVDRAVVTRKSAGSLPTGVAVDNQQRVWIANYFSGSVTCYGTDGVAIAGMTYATGATPAAIASDPDSGDVFVANVDGNSISRIRAGVVTTFALPVGMKPGGIAIAADHLLWVAGNGDGRVRRYTPEFVQVGTETFISPGLTAVAFDPRDGVAWIGSPNGQRIMRLSPAGAVLGNYASGAFPSSIAIDRRGHLWVAGGGMLAEHAP